MRPALRLALLMAAALAALTVATFLLGGEALEAWAAARLADPGSRLAAALIIFALLAGDIVLPVPSSLTALAAGTLFGAVWGTLIAGAGLSAGALAGLVVARRLGRGAVRRRLGPAEFARLEALLARAAPLVVLLARPVPVLAETTVLAAGACGARPALLAAPIVAGSFATAGVYAWLGAQAAGWPAFLGVFALSCLLPAAGWLLLRRLSR